MKRFMVFIMVFVMIFCLTGCTGDPDIGTSGPDGTTASEPSGTEESEQPAFVFPAGSAGTDEEIAGWEIQDSVNLTESLNIPLWTKQWYSKNKKLTDVCCATNGLGETYCVIRTPGEEEFAFTLYQQIGEEWEALASGAFSFVLLTLESPSEVMILYRPLEMEILFDSEGDPTVIGYYEDCLAAYRYDRTGKAFSQTTVCSLDMEEKSSDWYCIIDFAVLPDRSAAYFYVYDYEYRNNSRSSSQLILGYYDAETGESKTAEISPKENGQIGSPYITYSSYDDALYVAYTSSMKKGTRNYECSFDLYRAGWKDETFSIEYVANIQTDSNSMDQTPCALIENQMCAAGFFTDSNGNIFIAYGYTNHAVGAELQSYLAVVSKGEVRKYALECAAEALNLNWSVEDFFILEDNIYYLETHYHLASDVNHFYIGKLDPATGKTSIVKEIELPAGMHQFMIEMSMRDDGIDVIYLEKDTDNTFHYLKLG